MCSSNEVQHRDEDGGREEGPSKGEHAGQLANKLSAKYGIRERKGASTPLFLCDEVESAEWRFAST